MLQFSPGEYIPITRQLEDPTDDTTRYVRAYIYKYKGSGTGTLLDTLDLTDKTGQRFEYLYQTPQDSDPYTLSVIIKVFDNSGYTTESTRYERSYQTYLVAERWGMMYRAGGGVDVNYDKVRKIVKEEIGSIPKPVFPKSEKVDFGSLLNALKEVNQSVKNIEIPKPERIDFSSTIKAIENVQREVRAIKIPEPEKIDLLPILTRIKTTLDDFLKNITATFTGSQKELIEKFGDLKKELKNSTFSVAFPGAEAKLKSEEPPVKKRRIFL